MIESISDILIITDVDGTLLREKQGISKENLEAIKRFTDKGGRFTVSTGRAIDVARYLLKDIPINAPSVHINGGYFYDWKKNEIIELSVMDDGVGLAAAAAHPNSMKNSSGYGLSNIDKRIKLAYGEDYGLSIEERFPHGTIATIRIPAILEGNTSDQHSDN